MATSWERAVAQVQGEKTGTGFVVHREERLLLTSAHIVGAVAQVEVQFAGHGGVVQAEVVQNWAPDLDAALLQVGEVLPEGVEEAWLGLDVVAGHGFRSLGYHYAGEGAPIPIEGQIRGPGELGGQPAIFLSSIKVAEGMSGAPLGDAESGLVVGLVRRFHPEARWLACGVPLSAIAERWPRLRELTAETRYRELLQTTYGFWEHRFTQLEMAAQERERLPEDRRGWVPPCFSVLEEREASEGGEGEPPAVHRVPLPGGLAEGLERYEGVVLLGEPGAGKTTALQHLAGQLALDSGRIPVLVTLRRYERDEAMLTFLRRTWALALRQDLEDAIKWGETEPLPLHLVEETATPLAALLDHWLEAGRLVLLLDGLNEIPGLAPEDLLVSRLAAFVDRARARGNQVVVACRVLDYAALRQPLERPLQQVALEPLDEERIRTFLSGYLGEEEGVELAIWLESPEHHALRELCEVPFFLRLVAYLYQRDREPPSRRVDLLNEYVKVAVKREQGRLEQDWEPGLLVSALSELALAMQEQGTLEVWQSEARPHLAAFPQGGADGALRIAEGAGLLRVVLTTDLRGDRVLFSHQLWQQDMAGRSLVERSGGDGAALWRALQPHVLDERWAEVVVLATARAQDATRILDGLLKGNRNDFHGQRLLFLAAEALAEGARAREETEQRVTAELVRVVTAQHWTYAGLGESAWDAIAALARLGRGAEVAPILLALARGAKVGTVMGVGVAMALVRLNRAEDLLALAKDKEVAARVRQEAARGLGQLGRVEEAMSVLLELVRDETVGSGVRVRATEELLHLGGAEDLLTLARDAEVPAGVRWKAVWGLRNRGQAEDLLALARDEQVDAEVRAVAVRALGRLGRAEDLLSLAQDEAVAGSVRATAVGQLDDMGFRIPEDLRQLLAEET